MNNIDYIIIIVTLLFVLYVGNAFIKIIQIDENDIEDIMDDLNNH